MFIPLLHTRFYKYFQCIDKIITYFYLCTYYQPLKMSYHNCELQETTKKFAEQIIFKKYIQNHSSFHSWIFHHTKNIVVFIITVSPVTEWFCCRIWWSWSAEFEPSCARRPNRLKFFVIFSKSSVTLLKYGLVSLRKIHMEGTPLSGLV